jgi:hypothetical protein
MSHGGGTWRGSTVAESPVLWLAGEGMRSLPVRYAAWCAAHPGREPTQSWRADLLPRLDAAGIAMVRAEIERCRPGIIVLDTFAQAFPGDDENDAAAVAAFMRELRAIAEDHALLVLLVHQTNKNTAGERIHRARGSIALAAEVDTMLHVAHDGERPGVVLRPVKQRDGEMVRPIRLELVPTAGSVILVPAREPADDATPADQAADAVAAVIAALGALGEATSADDISIAAGLRQQRGRAAVRAAIRDGQIHRAGTDRRPSYHVAGGCVGCGGVACAPLVPPSHTGDTRGRAPGAGVGCERRLQPGRHGTPPDGIPGGSDRPGDVALPPDPLFAGRRRNGHPAENYMWGGLDELHG